MEKINKLVKLFKNEGIDGYIVPKNDKYFGEYVSDNQDRLKYLTNFSGTFGFALILKKKNYLFVDGRYTLQANIQSGKFYKIKTLPKENPRTVLGNQKIKIGFDPKLFTKKILNFFFKKTEFEIVPIRENLIDRVWKRTKKDKIYKFYKLPQKAVDRKIDQKIETVISEMKRKRADFKFITASENNAWLFNIRGQDAKFAPLPNCYVLINSQKKIFFFCDLKKISSSFKNKFKNLKFIDINYTEKVLSNIYNKKFIIDANTCSIFFENIISKNNIILDSKDLIYLSKSIKTKKEISNTRQAHIYDGAALTKYLIWIKKNFKTKKITEISGERKLLNFRRKNKYFKFPSFPTISGTGPNGAIIHYRASKKTNLKLKNGDIYLVDSGGQYNFGTTDVTRTISLGNKNKKIKNIFTRVLKGHIAVANFKLKTNTKSSAVDNAARKYLKQINLDYMHGTGHGVGYFLNVHEGPQSISKNNNTFFREGMIFSNEPGYYKKNKFGIRIENLIFIRKIKKKIFFENLTMVPIDKTMIDISILNTVERKWINSYHNRVFKNIKSFMNRIELSELKKACSAI